MIRNLLNNIVHHKNAKVVLFYAASIAFLLLSVYLVVKKETLIGALIPIAIIVLLVVIFSYDKLVWLAVFFAPLSIPLSEIFKGLPINMSLPTEPLLFGLLLLFIFSFLSGKRIGTTITRHPISIVIYFYLFWMAITCVSSTIPLVSIKYWLARVWFVVVYYFMLTYLFKDSSNINKMIWLYCIALVPVVGYALFRHLGYGLYDDQAAHFVMNPFFNDHTSYGAAFAFFIPFLLSFMFGGWIKRKYKIWVLALLFLFIMAEILSYSRASWLSLIFGLGIWTVMKLKIRFRTLFVTTIALLLIGFTFQNQILLKLEQNSTDSSADLMDHITSMTNISTDASNLERINRWNCALRLFKDKPIFGWGPGTYAMNYAPFQLSKDRTIISTNYGDGGNAHSEYLGALAETGIMGAVMYLLLSIFVMYYGVNTYSRVTDKRLKSLTMAAVISFSTYIFHGFFNNFLDTDKISLPFWGSIAIIVAIDIYSKNQNKQLEETTE